MQFGKSDFVRGAAVGLLCAAAIAVVAIPVLVWGHERAPEFFGAFAAAIVAAIAVVIGAYYQAELTRNRDDEVRKRAQVGELVELYFWLGHAAREMEFIATLLARMHTRMTETSQSQLEFPLDQFREIVSAQFMDELLVRARVASALPFDVAVPIVHVLYGTYSEADRIYRLRGASESYRPTIAEMAKYSGVTHARVEKLNEAIAEIETYLCRAKGIDRFLDA